MKKNTKPTSKISPLAPKNTKPTEAVVKKSAKASAQKTTPVSKAVKTTKPKVRKSPPVNVLSDELVPAVVRPSQAPKVVKSSNVKADSVPAALSTTITAAVDVGFGNLLTLRGEGAGLSWDNGVLLTCAAADRWVISLPPSATPVVFKFLLNDSVWSIGDNFTLPAGTDMVYSPSF